MSPLRDPSTTRNVAGNGDAQTDHRSLDFQGRAASAQWRPAVLLLATCELTTTGSSKTTCVERIMAASSLDLSILCAARHALGLAADYPDYRYAIQGQIPALSSHARITMCSVLTAPGMAVGAQKASQSWRGLSCRVWSASQIRNTLPEERRLYGGSGILFSASHTRLKSQILGFQLVLRQPVRKEVACTLRVLLTTSRLSQCRWSQVLRCGAVRDMPVLEANFR